MNNIPTDKKKKTYTKSKRRVSRERILQVLYAWDAGGMEIEENSLKEVRFVYPIIEKEDEVFSNEILLLVKEGLSTIDIQIEEASKNWRIARMDKVDLSILRLSSIELNFLDSPVPVVINEAIELAKTYGSENSPRFINGILNKLAKDIKK
jgi:transcription antitermination protein NusB